jgi:gamma-glutamyltranspeptidase/glutathione hydrolase
MPFRKDVRSVTMPGCVDGWLALHERFGRLPIEQVIQPARHYAEAGFPASPTLAAAVREVHGLDGADDFTRYPSLTPGDRLTRPGVARALAAIEEQGRKGYYEGEFGCGLLRVGKGLFTAEDLAAPSAEWTDAIGCEAFGHVVWSAPPNSQGYVTLASAWIASGMSIPHDPDDPVWGHLLIEATRFASFDRIDLLHEHAEAKDLIDPHRLEARRQAIDRSRASTLGGTFDDGGTVGVCAVDEQRMAVSLLQSNAAGFGSMVTVPDVGIFLHNRGIGFSLSPGHPAEYGPGRRPPHTLSPAAVTTGQGKLHSVLATMGGDSQPQILLQLLARDLVTGQDPGEAVAAGRWVLSNGQDPFGTWRDRGLVRVLIEGHCPPSWGPGLTEAGHLITMSGPFDHAFGHAHLIRNEKDHLAGGTDPRPRFGAAAAF